MLSTKFYFEIGISLGLERLVSEAINLCEIFFTRINMYLVHNIQFVIVEIFCYSVWLLFKTNCR